MAMALGERHSTKKPPAPGRERTVWESLEADQGVGTSAIVLRMREAIA
ncbi:hypothetical protein Hhel01_03223 [Haloferula helveola]